VLLATPIGSVVQDSDLSIDGYPPSFFYKKDFIKFFKKKFIKKVDVLKNIKK
jgi:hypothetical protein